MKSWLTQKEAAEYLKMKTNTFRNYVCKGFFPYYQHPKTGTKRFLAGDLDEVMKYKPAKEATEILKKEAT